MAIFFRATLNIPSLHPIVAVHSLMIGLYPGPFFYSLYVDLPENMDALCAQASRYISMEENAGARKMKVSLIPTPFVALSARKKRMGKFKAYAPLNASRNVILQEACNLELI